MLGKRDVIVLALLLGIIGIVAFAAYAMGVPLCLFHHLTGIPCPCSGTTRACLALLRGDVIGALEINPLVVVVVFLGPLVLWLMARRKSWPWAVVISTRVLAWTAVLLNWAYLLYRDLGQV